MNILVIPSEPLVTKKHPLGGIFQYEQSMALARAGHKVVIISTGYLSIKDFVNGYPYEKYEKYENLEIFRYYKYSFIPRRFITPKYMSRLQIKLFKFFFLKYINNNGLPDLIHAHNFLFAGVISGWVKENFSIPLLITEHSTAFARNLIPSSFNSVFDEVIKKTDYLTCVSTPFAKILLNKFNVEFNILHNIVDDLFFKNPLPDRTIKNFIFLNAASLEDKKNHKFLIEVFANNFKGSCASLRIAGDGPLMLDLVELTKLLGVENQVVFLGQISRISLCQEMLNANCFVLSSTYETFGVVLIEAMASGLPLIATKSGGPEDIINQNNGILIDQNSSEQLSNAMNYMYLNAHTYHPEALRKEAKDRFGHKSFVDKVTKIYQEIILRNKT